jgi:hypothetical protein
MALICNLFHRQRDWCACKSKAAITAGTLRAHRLLIIRPVPRCRPQPALLPRRRWGGAAPQLPGGPVGDGSVPGSSAVHGVTKRLLGGGLSKSLTSDFPLGKQADRVGEERGGD